MQKISSFFKEKNKRIKNSHIRCNHDLVSYPIIKIKIHFFFCKIIHRFKFHVHTTRTNKRILNLTNYNIYKKIILNKTVEKYSQTKIL